MIDVAKRDVSNRIEQDVVQERELKPCLVAYRSDSQQAIAKAKAAFREAKMIGPFLEAKAERDALDRDLQGLLKAWKIVIAECWSEVLKLDFDLNPNLDLFDASGRFLLNNKEIPEPSTVDTAFLATQILVVVDPALVVEPLGF